VERVAASASPEALHPALSCATQSAIIERLGRNVERAAERISDLVAAVKSYSHMDQAPTRVPTNIHSGLDTTILVLGHALRHKNIKL
jgi:hypothetical protein